jgi:hypothetical protein
MKRIALEVEEVLTYRRKIYVNVPDEMEDSEIERILTKAEKEEYLSEFMYILDANLMETTDGYDDDLSSPWSSEVECTEYYQVDEKGEEIA